MDWNKDISSMIEQDMFTEEPAVKVEPVEPDHPAKPTKTAAELLVEIEADQGLSAREKNQLKRKAKRMKKEEQSAVAAPVIHAQLEKKARTAASGKALVTDQPQDQSKVVIRHRQILYLKHLSILYHLN